MRLVVLVVLCATLWSASAGGFGDDYKAALTACVGDLSKCQAEFGKVANSAKDGFPDILKTANCADPSKSQLAEQDKAVFAEVTKLVKTMFEKAEIAPKFKAAAFDALKKVTAYAEKPTQASCEAIVTELLKLPGKTDRLMTEKEIEQALADGESVPGEKGQEQQAFVQLVSKLRTQAKRSLKVIDPSDTAVMPAAPTHSPTSRKLLALMYTIGSAGVPVPAIPWANLVAVQFYFFGPATVVDGALRDMTMPKAFKAHDAAHHGVGAHVGPRHIKPNFAALCNDRACLGAAPGGGVFSAFTSWADASNAIGEWYNTGINVLANSRFFAKAYPKGVGAKYPPPAGQANAIACYRDGAAPKAGFQTAVPKCPGKHAAFACHCKSAAPQWITTIVRRTAAGQGYVLTHYPWLP